MPQMTAYASNGQAYGGMNGYGTQPANGGAPAQQMGAYAAAVTANGGGGSAYPDGNGTTP